MSALPIFCEAGHVRNYAYYAGVTGCPLYIVHTTTRESIQEILKAKAEGIKIYAQTGHHYLTLSHDVWKINVPLRDEETMAYLWQALRAGNLDCVGTDHVDWGMSREQMDKGNVWETSSGFPSRVESYLPVMLTEGVHKPDLSGKAGRVAKIPRVFLAFIPGREASAWDRTPTLCWSIFSAL